MDALFGDDLMRVDSSKQLLDYVLIAELFETFFYFLEHNSLKLVYIHLLVDFDHRSFVNCFESSSENGGINIVLFWEKHLQEQLFQPLEHVNITWNFTILLQASFVIHILLVPFFLLHSAGVSDFHIQDGHSKLLDHEKLLQKRIHVANAAWIY